MSRERPINADVPGPEPPAEERQPTQPHREPKPAPEAEKVEPKVDEPEPEAAKTEPKPSATQPRRKRQPIPGALKLVGVLVVFAIAFIVLAVVWGTNGAEDEGGDQVAPAPAPAAEEPAREAPTSDAAEELGFPAFATVNTTRVGGSDPASNAAAVALAVFPSTTPAQRPTAVTLVGGDDWAGGIAASVLMSAPVRAPLLISASDELPEPTAEALEALDPQGGPDSGGAAVFAIGDVAVPDGARARRLGGDSSAATAEAAAAEAAAIARLRDRLFGSAPEHVVIASIEEPRFAMPAAAWAARSGDPVLYAEEERLPRATVAALKRHPEVPVFVLGPPSVISSKVVRQIAALGATVKRVSGEDPVTNAIALARYASGSFGWNVNDPGHGFVIARDSEPLDAAAAAALSASGTWGPLLLTDDAATLPPELRDYFLDVKPGYTTNPTRAFYNHVWLIGDQEAIDVNQQAEVNELAALARIGGEG